MSLSSLQIPSPLAIGERSPELLLPPQEGIPQTTLYERFCGQPLVIWLSEKAEDLTGCDFVMPSLAIVADKPQDRLPCLGIQDQGRLRQLFWGEPLQSGQIGAVVLDPTLRVVARLTDLDQVLPCVEQIKAGIPSQPSVVTATAPVLMVPQVLDPELCQKLIAIHHTHHVASGMVRLVDGKPTLIADPKVKIRRDHRLEDPELMAQLSEALSRQVLPAIQAAFHYRLTRFEGFKVVVYEAQTGGYFRRHRDNITPDARHRRFALSINLNEDYQGGGLSFPEFGSQLYRPPAGGAIVFSGSLLHEATDVTAGRRYVVLSFLWGEDAS